MKKYLLSFIVLILLAAPLFAQLDEPMEMVKKNVDKVLNVLRNPELQGKSAVDRKKAALRSISDEMFHWPQLSKRVLAKKWDGFSADQQQEFITLFKDILEQAYIDRILAYKDEKVEYAGSRKLSDKQAEVETHILSGNSPVNLTYRLALIEGEWGIYDVIVEGVNLTQTYRNQFRDFLATKTAAQLLDHLREKVGQPKT